MSSEKDSSSTDKISINLRLTPLQVEDIDLAKKLGITKDRTEFCRDADPDPNSNKKR